ncbi:glyoxylate reductase [soil metagenome]
MTINGENRSRIVVISDSFHTIPEAVATLSDSGHDVTYVKGLTPWTELHAAGGHALANAHAIVMGRVPGVDAAAFSLAPQVRIVALHTSGSDTVDVAEATRRGVVVTNVKGVNAEQCAEFAMGLLLCVVRQIDRGDRAIRAGQWVSGTHTSMDVYGSTLGIVGLGGIGRAFVRRARAFGMKVIAHTRTPDMALAEELDIEYMPLDDVLRRADVLGLFASLSASTKGMIGARELGLMKRSAYLINIARGELIDQGALIEALRTRQIAGAALDVFEVEPLYNSPLFELDNVVLTPHQAGLTAGAKTRAAVRAARNALDGLAGTVPPDAINPHAFMTGESR